MGEIKRVIPKNSTVYIVGGENVISKDVEAQLIKEVNAKIVRLAGDTRYETSVKIAQNMKKVTGSTMEQAFVVGGFGEADAMSVAAVAANKTTGTDIAPIIVSKEDGLTQNAKDFLYANKTALTNVDVVGGTTKVSKQVIKDIEANVDSTDTVARVAGDNRQETNAKVISKFYAKGDASALTGVYVAKDGIQGNGVLIDALAVAPLAGRTATPIVLATDKLSEEQVNVIEKNAKDTDNAMTQAGHGIAQTVLDKLVKLLSL
ncbi:cell wall-binding repeat-containing protein [[Clostridium] dakarense]|uniref:cell wall-binding repeat-containing protein n=1 Tax=Faecalimicrobium dakarense TaxID=1301100 RepID=UPI0004BABC30|nr:cell wall-binding repeat-containing protein [[Clostridium] dakarense]